jgi:hypothetical protein
MKLTTVGQTIAFCRLSRHLRVKAILLPRHDGASGTTLVDCLETNWSLGFTKMSNYHV